MTTPKNAPVLLVLDFSGKRRVPGWLGWMALALGVLMCLFTLKSVYDKHVDLRERQAILDGLRTQYRASVQHDKGGVDKGPAAGDLDPARVRLVVSQLNAEWAGLFSDLVKARADDVKLMEIQADAARGVLRIVGQAPSLDVVLSYVGALQKSGVLHAVTLDSHAWQEVAGRSFVDFTASARWGNMP